MKSIAQIFNLEAESPLQRGGNPVVLGQKSNANNFHRVSLDLLEFSYIEDGTINNGINKFVSVIMGAGYQIHGSQETVEFTERFLASIGSIGGSTEWNSLLAIMFKHQAVYGRAFIEKIMDQQVEQILDLDFVDPKKMDYAKDGEGNLLLDRFSNPLGYVESLPLSTGTSMKLKSDKHPKTLTLETNQIFFDAHRIIQLKYHEIGDGFYPIGMVEPIYKISKWKLKILEATANVSYHTAFPTKYFRVGDQFHEPTADLLESVSQQLQGMNYRSSFALPSYVEPGILESKGIDSFDDQIQRYTEEESTTLGPIAFVTGTGGKTNKSTLSRQESLYNTAAKDIVEKTLIMLERELFVPLAAQNDLPDVPRIKWNDIDIDELNDKADRLVKYADKGLITPDAATEEYIRKIEGLPEGEKKGA